MVNKYDNYELKKATSLQNVPGTIKDGDGYIWDPSELPDKDFDDSKVPLEYRRLAIWMRSKLFGKEVRETIARLAEMFGMNFKELMESFESLDNRQDSVETYTYQSVTQMESDKNAVIANATVDSEVILARGGKDTLGERLDETTSQLADTANKIKPSWSVWEEFEQRVINVKWFGAKGDGINDDVPGIQAAIDFAEVTGGTVLMPRIDNNWTFLSKNENNNCIEIPSGVRLISEKLPIDKSKQIIKVRVQGVESVINMEGGGYIEIENLYIDANGLAKKGICSTDYITRFLIKNIRVNNATEIGVDIMGYLGELNSITTFQCPIGTKVHGGEHGGTSVQLNSVYSIQCGTNILLYNMTYSQLSTCASDRNIIGYHIVRCKGITILNPGVEDNITTDPDNKLVNYQPFLIERSTKITLTNPSLIVSPSVPGYTIPSLIKLVDVDAFNIESIFINFLNYDKILKIEGNTTRVQVNDRSFDAGRVTNDSTSSSRVEYMGFKADQEPKNRWNASLLAGWTGEVRYTKNDIGVVTVYGEISGGDITEYTKIANLNEGYRPSKNTPILLVANVTGIVGQYLYLSEQGGLHVPRGATLSNATSYHFNISYEVAR